MDLTVVTFINFLGSIQIVSLLISIECFKYIFFQLKHNIVITLNPLCYIVGGIYIYAFIIITYNAYKPEYPLPYMIIPNMGFNSVMVTIVLTAIISVNYSRSVFNLPHESVNRIFRSILDNMNIKNDYKDGVSGFIQLVGSGKINISPRTKWLPWVSFSIYNVDGATKNKIIDRFKKEISSTTIERENRFFTISFYFFLGVLFLFLAFYKHIF